MPKSLNINSFLRPLVLLLMESSICTICAYSGFSWSVYFTILVCKLCPLFQIISDLWPVLILEIFSSWDIKKGQFQFSVTFLVVLFWSVNWTNDVCMSSHILDMDNVLFEGFQYLVFQVLAFLSILILPFVAIFTDLEMLQLWSVNYRCQVCKLHIYFGHVQNFGQYLYLRVLSKQQKYPTVSFCLNICCIAILLKRVFLCTFFEAKSPCFLTKNCSKSSSICVSFSSKKLRN